MRTALTTTALLGCLALGACASSVGAGSDGSSSAARPPVAVTTPAHSASKANEGSAASRTSAAPAAPVTAKALAAKAHCLRYQPAHKALSLTSGHCNAGTFHVEVATFADNAARDNYVRLGRSIFPKAHVRQGDRWAAVVVDESAPHDVLSSFGGDDV